MADLTIKGYRLPLWASLFTLAGLAILITLGVWQVQRLEWKTSILQAIEEGRSAGVFVLSARDLGPDSEYLSGEIRGRFIYAREVLLQAKVHDGEPGHHVITPFLTADGALIFVNRGWVPLGYQKGAAPIWDINIQEVKTVFGMLRRPAKPNMFVPDNDPVRDQWYSLKLDEIGAAKRIENFSPMVFVMQGRGCDQASRTVFYPDPCGVSLNLRNNHAQYALFWFAMAGALLGVYVLRFIRKEDEQIPEE